MNILFITTFEVDEQKGGVERVTASLSKILRKVYGHQCYSAYYFSSTRDDGQFTGFEGKKHLQNNKIKSFREIVELFNIDIIINQGDFGGAENIHAAIADYPEKKQILVHHFSPGWDENFFMIKDLILSTTFKNPIKLIKFPIKLVLYPWLKKRWNKRIPMLYRKGYNNADITVLLSKYYKMDFMNYAHISDDSKFAFIPNVLSFEDFVDESQVRTKIKTVLIVSRMEEPQKRISLALKIWQKVKTDIRSNGWKLVVVGDGLYLNKYINYVNKNKIPDIEFLGKRGPIEYYKESSIFMMTSKSEGWPLTLTEAQQFGVVPIAFDSFQSLKEIITNGENGLIIPECDCNGYTEKLLNLMKCDEYRHALALKAINSSKKLQPEKIGELWNSLFNKLQLNNTDSIG